MAALAGFADRNKALSDLSATNDNSTAAAVLFITLLFITFECMPVLVKLIDARGPYDEDSSEEQPSELKSLIRIQYAVSCWKKKTYLKIVYNISTFYTNIT